MSLGIFLKGVNSRYFKRYLDFWNEFLPQIILMLALIGYMDLLIIVKWLTDFTNKEHFAPSIINIMIDMFLNGGHV